MGTRDDEPTMATYWWFTARWTALIIATGILCFVLFKLFHPLIGMSILAVVIAACVCETVRLYRRERDKKIERRMRALK